jgi:hypothetical protein
MKKNQAESKLQEVCVTWFRLQYREPRFLIFSIPNGGYRNKIEAFYLKKTGSRAGVFDLLILTPFSYSKGLFVELKIAPNRLTVPQRDFKKMVNDLGYTAQVCYSFSEFQQVVSMYLGDIKKTIA